MKKVIGFLSNSKAVGMDAAEAFTFSDDDTDEYISKVIWYAAVEHADNYFNLIEGDPSESGFDEDDDYNNYILLEEVEAHWELYNGENHDNQRSGGGSFEEDFEE